VRLDRSWIETHIPHQGKMCLLDEVVAWDAIRITCRSATHRAPDNPLRAAGRLGPACGIEYAAQAIAVHGALIAAQTNAAPTLGFLASVRSVALNVCRLDDVQEDLVARGERISGDHRAVQYEFSVSGGERLLLSGRATIVFEVLDPPKRP
jgi:predicted hotdog family 3-hydroxylacyl-ACP dehydratase